MPLRCVDELIREPVGQPIGKNQAIYTLDRWRDPPIDRYRSITPACISPATVVVWG